MSAKQRNKQAIRYRRSLLRRQRRREARRGVLLLVVLSILILFMLIGTTYVLTASSSRDSSKQMEKAKQTSLQAGDRLERAMLQLLRDTNNPASAIRFHSLLRDVYGTDGFVGQVYAGPPRDVGNLSAGYETPKFHNNDAATFPDYVSRYSGATNTNAIGVSRGQFIDIYVEDDLGQVVAEGEVGLDAAYVVDLELNEQGLTTNHQLSRTGGYYNGCLLTVLDGPAKGRTARIVQYDYLTEFTGQPGHPVFNGIGRFRVLAFPRSDGTPLQLGVNPQLGETNDLIKAEDTANVIGQIADNDTFTGARIMVNGRPYNGVGVGQNYFAEITGPKLSAVEVLTLSSGVDIGLETALTPNAVYHNSSRMAYFDALNSPAGASSFGGDPAAVPVFRSLVNRYNRYPGPGGSDESYDAADFQNMYLAMQWPTPRSTSRVLPQGSSTPVEIATYYQAGVGVAPQKLVLDDVPLPSYHRPALVNFWFNRLYSAPWLAAAVNDPVDRLRTILQPFGPDMMPGTGDEIVPTAVAAQVVAIKRKIMLRPQPEDHPNFNGSNPASRLTESVATALANMSDASQLLFGGQITFPYWEASGPWDVDNDNDGVPDSIWVDLGDPVQELSDGRMYKPLYAIMIQDLDGRLNLNTDGSGDHLAGEDLDLSTDNDGNEDFNLVSGASVLLGLSPSALLSSNQLPHGEGWGPGDISLRPVLSPQLLTTLPGLIGDPRYDDYTRLLVGRPVDAATNPAQAVANEVVWGRLGSVRRMQPLLAPADQQMSIARGYVTPGVTYDDTDTINSRDSLVSMEMFAFPEFDSRSANKMLNWAPASARGVAIVRENGAYPNGYSKSPDLRGKYATGISYGGAVYEAATDPSAPPMLADSPYETNVMQDARRGATADYNFRRNDDAPFSPAELERLLRSHDADAGRLPDRLWQLVDAFDANKLQVQLNGPDPLQMPAMTDAEALQAQASAEIEAASNRRQVTTESYEIPAPSENWTVRMMYGADGRPGAGLVDDDNDGVADDADESGFYLDGDNEIYIDADFSGAIDNANEANLAANAFFSGVDDYAVVMGALPSSNARLVDFLRYRVTLELKRKGVIPANLLPDVDRFLVASGSMPFDLQALDVAQQQINRVIYGDNLAPSESVRDDGNNPLFVSYGGLLAPELAAGLKMDLNRPFGDGRDNNGNGVVDEPQEAGEPWIDTDGNGVWNSNEPYLDLDGDGRFYADTDGNGTIVPTQDWIDLGIDTNGDGTTELEPPFNNLWANDANGDGYIFYGEFTPFDDVGGVDANARGVSVGAGGVVGAGVLVRDDCRMARQLYARHLYCLALLLMDENYLTPFDDRDPQVMHYLDAESIGSVPAQVGGGNVLSPSVAYQIREDLVNNGVNTGSATPEAEARRQALRKLTCRQIAQWAINCVEMRDPDAICTPFEYDENPWDGWNVVDTSTDYDGDGQITPNDVRVYPIDGDLSTDENHQYTREVTVDGWTNPVRRDRYGGADLPDDLRMAAYDQTRGVVWGAERPELLLTEGLALHDRGLTNELVGNILPIGQATSNTGEDPEDDLDQYFKPRSGAFVEVFNPWSSDGPSPAELYRDRFGFARVADINKDNALDADNDVEVEGVVLDRLSDGVGPVIDYRGEVKTAGGQPILAPSPVWRMICIEQHPQLRNDDPFDNELERGGISTYANGDLEDRTAPKAYRDLAMPGIETEQAVRQSFGAGTTLSTMRGQLTSLRGEVPNPVRIPDPDFPGFDRDAVPYVEEANNRFYYVKPLEYIEREWYFTREEIVQYDGRVDGAKFDPQNVRLCVPDRPIVVSLSTGLGRGVQWPNGTEEQTQLWPEGLTYAEVNGGGQGDLLIYPRSFPPLEQIEDNGADYQSLRLAPILPGQYGVIGSAGTVYGGGTNDDYNGRFITRMGRYEEEDLPSNMQATIFGSRRIELCPNPNPFLHQVCIGSNFGDEYRLMAPAGDNGEFMVNATDPTQIPADANDPATPLAGAVSLRHFNDDPQQPCYYTSPEGPQGPYEIDPADTDDMRLYCVRPAVAVPVVGMNISAPLDNYLLRRAELHERDSNGVFDMLWYPQEYGGEGTFGRQDGNNTVFGFDEPFDLAPELIVNHTTPNYRSVHLQRLANPLLAWNPPPLKTDGTPHLQHDPNRSVNPYVTVDSMSLDLTAFNSVSADEENIDPGAVNPGGNNLKPRTEGLADLLNQAGAINDPAELHKQPHYRPLQPSTSAEDDSKKIIMTMSTQYRGKNQLGLEYAADTGSATPPDIEATLQPGRLIWQRERPNQLIDVMDDRIDTSSQDESNGGYKTDDGSEPVMIAKDDLLGSRGLVQDRTIDIVLQHSLGYDNSAVIRRFFLNPNFGQNNLGVDDRKYYRGEVQIRGSFVSSYDYDAFSGDEVNYCYRVDVNGDGRLGDILGTPQVNLDNEFIEDDPRTPQNENEAGDYRDDFAYPWMHWGDRPFVSAPELLQAPVSSSSRMTLAFSVTNPYVQNPPSRYDGFSEPLPDGATETNQARIGAATAPFGHLLNAFQASSAPAAVIPVGDQAIPIGAPHLHRVLDYVHTPSRYVATDLMLDPAVFNLYGPNGIPEAQSTNPDDVTLFDPRRPWQAPFNRVAKYREPGKVNLNTVVGQYDAAEAAATPDRPLDSWSDVYDGLMHRLEDTNYIDPSGVLLAMGHLGPAWRDVVASRRGYHSQPVLANTLDYSEFSLHQDFPSRFANPFRSTDAGDLVPLPQMVQLGVDASIYRAHPVSPGADGAWGVLDVDDAMADKRGDAAADRDLILDNATEAGRGDDVALVKVSGALPNSSLEGAVSPSPFQGLPVVPLFGEETREAALDAGRNPGVAYSPMTRLANLTTTRSGSFAVWITVGFFEVERAPDWTDPNVQLQFNNDQVLYSRVYPEGYQLGQEIGSDTGDVKRFRAFYLIDRTKPVAFRPGENMNAEEAILLRRRIE